MSNGQIMPLNIKRLRSSKRIKLRIDRGGKAAVISAPLSCTQKAALNFANENKNWIEAQISKSPKRIEFAIGNFIPLYGALTRLEIAPPRSKPQLETGVLFIPTKPENFDVKTKIILKKMAQEAASAHIQGLEPLLLKKATKIRITDTKSRWGSCASNGVVSLCWRLILAPPEVFQYVIAHEMAHLKEMNHSAKFWAEVARLYPDYKKHYKWLKQNGAALHGIGQ